MILDTIGWSVVHSLWQGALLAGIAALVLALLPDRQAPARHAVACAALMLMVVCPVLTALSAVDLLGNPPRVIVSAAIDSTVGLAAVVVGREWIVRAAAAMWIVGVVICLVHVRVEWRRAAALGALDLSDPGALVQREADALRARLALPASVEILRSARAAVPMVLGWWRPVILLPEATADTLPNAQLRAVIAHELAHVRRRDYLANMVQIAAETLLFHHPAARWISNRIRAEREYCCDDVAVAVGGNALTYARALAALEDARDEGRLVVAASSGTLLDRIQRIVGDPRPVLTPTRGLLALAIGAIISAALLALTMVVPPAMPLDARLRSKTPAPAGAVIPPGSPATGPALRKRSR